MPYTINFPTHLEIDMVPLSTPAWEHLNLYALLGAATVRGENVVMPGAVGVRPVRRRPTETNYTVDMAIYGDRDWQGDPYDDPMMGLWSNLAHLRANVVDPLAKTNSVRTATIVLPEGTLTAAVQVLGFEITENVGTACVMAGMEIAVLRGQFV